jgi:hypothetical protein
VLPCISTLVTMIIGLPVNIFIGIVAAVVIVVPGTYAAVVGAGMGTDVAMVVGDDTKSFVFADGVGEGTLPVTMFTRAAVETVILAGTFGPRMVGVNGVATTALVAIAGGLAG